ncbi:uncharacterized protein [Miscanthus floridulus]|uniref:uncharacterized protein n=1 Tax=Miscanthus floridulus TaxID=154761 RepID=UPI003457CF31
MWAWARSREEGCPFSRHDRAEGTLLAGRTADDEGAAPVGRAVDAGRGAGGKLGARVGGTLLAGHCADDEGALPVERVADAGRGAGGGLGAAPGAPGTRWVAALGWQGVGAGARARGTGDAWVAALGRWGFGGWRGWGRCALGRRGRWEGGRARSTGASVVGGGWPGRQRSLPFSRLGAWVWLRECGVAAGKGKLETD